MLAFRLGSDLTVGSLVFILAEGEIPLCFTSFVCPLESAIRTKSVEEREKTDSPEPSVIAR